MEAFVSDISSSDFKSDFLWGSASASYQVEGAASSDGRSPSIWDTFCLVPGAIKNNENGTDGVKAYYRTKEDVKMMKKMGLKAYRFSLSWSRILPGGTLHKGINKAGVAYYNDLINELKINDIEPCITLFHWDLPSKLEEEYLGFLNKKIIHDFIEYAEFCFTTFGDRVKYWITLNEPHSFSMSGYGAGVHAPGRGGPLSSLVRALASGNNLEFGRSGGKRKLDNKGLGDPGTEPYIVAHNLLLAHANAVKLYRQRFQESQKGMIGISLNSTYYKPLDPLNADDNDAALRALDFAFGWFMEPLSSGKYPDIMVEMVGHRLPKFTGKETNLVKGSYDFVGVNYYTSKYATTAPPPTSLVSALVDSRVHQQAEGLDGINIGPQGGTYWLYSYPPGLRGLLKHIKLSYGDPLIIITENGWPDKVTDTSLDDPQRIEYYNAHLQSLRDAINFDGVRVAGYFAWTLMDNFEWDEGYTIRFGLFYVDYTQGIFTRYPKSSALWFKNFLINNKPAN